MFRRPYPYWPEILILAGAALIALPALLEASCAPLPQSHAATRALTGARALRALGSVTFLDVPASTCGPSQGLTINRCKRATVVCPGVANMDALVSISDPSAPVVATDVFLAGGGGGGRYDGAFGTVAVQTILVPLASAGHQIIQYAWQSQPNPNGFYVGPGGGAVMCRPASLLHAIWTQIAPASVAHCASGNSGGGDQIGYALAWYGAGADIDMALDSSSPPHARIDEGCLGFASKGDAGLPAWAYTCRSRYANTCPLCGYTWQPNGGSAAITDAMYGGTACQDAARTGMATQAQLDQWRADSVLSLDAELSYPQTRLRFAYGSLDTSEVPGLAREYALAVTSTHSVATYAQAAHDCPRYQDCATGIYNAFVADCHRFHP